MLTNVGICFREAVCAVCECACSGEHMHFVCTSELHVSKSKDKQRLSGCLPAAPVIDVNGNTQMAADELLTHERQTTWLPLSFDRQIRNKIKVHLTPS